LWRQKLIHNENREEATNELLEWTNKVIYDRAASIFHTVKTDAQKQSAVWSEEYRRIRKARNLCIEILRKLNKAWTVPNSSQIKIWNKCSNLFEKLDEILKDNINGKEH
jgi:hypothetical protein